MYEVFLLTILKTCWQVISGFWRPHFLLKIKVFHAYHFLRQHIHTTSNYRIAKHNSLKVTVRIRKQEPISTVRQRLWAPEESDEVHTKTQANLTTLRFECKECGIIFTVVQSIKVHTQYLQGGHLPGTYTCILSVNSHSYKATTQLIITILRATLKSCTYKLIFWVIVISQDEDEIFVITPVWIEPVLSAELIYIQLYSLTLSCKLTKQSLYDQHGLN